MALTTRQVTAHYQGPDATPAAGYITFTTTTPLTSPADDTIIWPQQVHGALDENGDLDVTLLATDSAGVSPTGWAYRIEEHVAGASRAAWLALVPAGAGPLDLADISPLVEQPDLVAYVTVASVGEAGGPAGPLDQDGLIPEEQIPESMGGGGNPSNTVVSQTSYSQPSTPGSSGLFSRGDHSHGTPAPPTPGAIGASNDDHNHAGTYDPAGTAASAVADHSADTTDVHGIQDTAALETQTGAAAKVAGHVVAEDPHGDQAFASDQADAAQVAAQGYADNAVANAVAALRARVAVARFTTGDITLPNTSSAWQVLRDTTSAVVEVAVPAAVGDWVQAHVVGMRTQTADRYIDLAVITGAGPTPQRYLTTGTSSPAAEGDPGWYPAGGFAPNGGPRGFVVQAGDLDGGTVRFAVVVKTTGNTGTLFASTTYPLILQATNLRTLAA